MRNIIDNIDNIKIDNLIYCNFNFQDNRTL